MIDIQENMLEFHSQICKASIEKALEMKAEKVFHFEPNIKDLAGHILIVVGSNMRHISAMYSAIMIILKEWNIGDVMMEGMNSNGWIIIDLGYTIIHFKTKEMLEYYNLEELLLTEGPKIEIYT